MEPTTNRHMLIMCWVWLAIGLVTLIVAGALRNPHTGVLVLLCVTNSTVWGAARVIMLKIEANTDA